MTIPRARRASRRDRWLWLGLAGGSIALAAALVIASRPSSTALSTQPSSTATPTPARVPASKPATALASDGHWIRTSLHGNVTALLTAPRQPSILLAATTTGVWRSVDGGATWRPDGAGAWGRAIFVLTDTSNSATVWAGGFDGTVYMRRGAAAGRVEWRRISPVLLTDPAYGPMPIYSLAVSPLPGHPILAGSMGAIFRGAPRGAGRAWRWTRVWQWRRGAAGSAGVAVTSLIVAPWDGRLVFGSLFEASPPIMSSHDGGRAWAPDASGLPATLPTQALASDSAHADRIFLTTMGGGVWQRRASGRWLDISAGLPQRHAMPLLQAGPTGAGVLVAGTMGQGVFEKQGAAAWHPLGRGLDGAAATVTSLIETTGPRPVLLAGTSAGVFRYVPAS